MINLAAATQVKVPQNATDIRSLSIMNVARV